MSEDEIIKRINYVIDNWYDENLEIDCRWLEGLLDLYNKQKEQIKELEEDNKHQWEERCKMAIELDNDVISKSKIKEMIKDLELFDAEFFDVETLKLVTKNSLQELLEE